ncbi:DUF5804 family protein [Methanoregula sp.]|uniref:DUF5804 family protein n=1 Tax=Methanoregula sp. TaxID=2052170 RepID=UPI002C3A68B4|nr:DUF5804 family protein [Methanoregula sp.]HVP95886.1 DUF5804 family protein [Methanoregula sp.]
MNILLIQREGTDLHHTLYSSETSRHALRFYHPKKIPCGVIIAVASLGSALSLVSELRWYLRRYVRETLFEVEPGIFCTHDLAQDIYYERTAILAKPWAFRRLYGFIAGKPARRLVMAAGAAAQDCAADLTGAERTIEVWCTEDEVEDIGDLITLEEAGEEPGPADSPGP